MFDSWTGAVFAAYGGLVCGTCTVGGLGNVIDPEDRSVRADAIVALTFGVSATLGAVFGYLLWNSVFPAHSPFWGFFGGMILLGQAAGWVASRFVEGDEALLLLLLVAPILAGALGGIGTLFGHPLAVAGGVVLGTVIGGNLAHALNEAAHEAAERAVLRRYGRYGRDSCYDDRDYPQGPLGC
jgi:phage shock protein PspC (stress-responsive transcriptional regulator)